MDFLSSAGGGSFELIPDKTYAKVRLEMQPPKAGKITEGYETILESGSRSISIKAIILEGQYRKRQIFTTLCTMSNGTENHDKWFEGSRNNIAGLLEQVRGADVTTNPEGYKVGAPGASHTDQVAALADIIHGAEVAVKITYSKGKNGYEDSNGIRILSRAGHDYKKYETALLTSSSGTVGASRPTAPTWSGGTPTPAMQVAPAFIDTSAPF